VTLFYPKVGQNRHALLADEVFMLKGRGGREDHMNVATGGEMGFSRCTLCISFPTNVRKDWQEEESEHEKTATRRG